LIASHVTKTYETANETEPCSYNGHLVLWDLNSASKEQKQKKVLQAHSRWRLVRICFCFDACAQAALIGGKNVLLVLQCSRVE
jgi:hypothetical protein